MIPYDVDPSLHNTEPHQPQLDDGFSPPALEPTAPEEPPSTVVTAAPVDPQLWDKSDF